jgi:type IV pilus assembly protein PilN
MPRINLLPHRETRRRERKLHFMIALGVATVAAVAVTFIAYLMFESMISGQEHRNDVLRREIKVLDKQIEEINSLENEKQRFIARMEIIEKLQRSRPEIVHLFDEVVRTLPDGVYLTSVTQTETKLKFEGVAQSSTRVSAFMRNIDSSEWLKNPELEVVHSLSSSDSFGSSFVLDAEQVSHAADDDEGARSAGRRLARRGPTP